MLSDCKDKYELKILVYVVKLLWKIQTVRNH